MPGVIRKFTKQFIVLCNVLVSSCMLLVYVLPKSNQAYFWFINLFALTFPFLVLIQIGFLVFWLLAKRKLTLIPIITLLLCIPLIQKIIAVNGTAKQTAEPGFKIATWNVHLLNFYERGGNHDEQMIQKAKELNAGVLAVQELVFSLDSNSYMSLDSLKAKLGFKYAVAGNDRSFGVHTNGGRRNERYFPFCVALFSNYPVLQWKKVQPVPQYNHTFIWADLLVGSDTIRCFVVHMQSMHFVKTDYDFIDNINDQDVENVKRVGRTLINKMKNANVLRAIQAHNIKEEVNKSPYPVILCGDFNDVPNSYAYQTIGKGLKDAHLEKGNGIGRTFQYLSPTLRIDYIWHSPSLVLQSTHVVRPSLSDHCPVTASFVLPLK
ncbi:MAG: endonuclease/exonuclease/phosphatase family protein [Chitinophagaceae bacterium]|nr:endonuclease/exonuclease/phosphatase family protein [Chitinophagaceae bacterium]